MSVLSAKAAQYFWWYFYVHVVLFLPDLLWNNGYSPQPRRKWELRKDFYSFHRSPEEVRKVRYYLGHWLPKLIPSWTLITNITLDKVNYYLQVSVLFLTNSHSLSSGCDHWFQVYEPSSQQLLYFSGILVFFFILHLFSSLCPSLSLNKHVLMQYSWIYSPGKLETEIWWVTVTLSWEQSSLWNKTDFIVAIALSSWCCYKKSCSFCLEEAGWV